MKLTNEMQVKEVEFQSATSFGIGMGAHSSMVDGNVNGAKVKGLTMFLTPAGIMWEYPAKISKETVCGLVPLPQCKNIILFNANSNKK